MDELTTPDAVRAYYKEPHHVAINKELTRIDRYCLEFISASPFIVLATSDEEGRADATPRGDAPGFVMVVDDKTLLIPDRRGNNRVDAMMNIVKNPHVGLLFLVPGTAETLRVNGSASIIIDEEMLAPLSADGKLPRAAIRVDVEEVYFQCGKALARSDLWNPERHVPRGTLTPFGKVLSEQCKFDYDPGLEIQIENDYQKGLY